MHGAADSPGEFDFIEYQPTELVAHFTDSYYYHALGDYYGKGTPMEDIKEHYREIFWDMILASIHRLSPVLRSLGVDTTDDFIFFRCNHDQSREDRDDMIAKTVDSVLMETLIHKDRV